MKNKKLWDKYVANNKDPYGKCCVDVARRVMELLDKDNTPLHYGYYPDINTPHGLIVKAAEDINSGGITGFMSGMVAEIVIKCHDRGKEFKTIWNNKFKGKGIMNPALMEIK
jgi:hypothetical protein